MKKLLFVLFVIAICAQEFAVAQEVTTCSSQIAMRTISYIQQRICGISLSWTLEPADYGKCNLVPKVMSIAFKVY